MPESRFAAMIVEDIRAVVRSGIEEKAAPNGTLVGGEASV
jgi:hypothetical protein